MSSMLDQTWIEKVFKRHFAVHDMGTWKQVNNPVVIYSGYISNVTYKHSNKLSSINEQDLGNIRLS